MLANVFAFYKLHFLVCSTHLDAYLQRKKLALKCAGSTGVTASKPKQVRFQDFWVNKYNYDKTTKKFFREHKTYKSFVKRIIFFKRHISNIL